MNHLTLLSLPLLLVACTSVTPQYDTQFGLAVRAALVQQTLHPEAGNRPDEVSGMDGKAVRESILLYQSSFREPPPVVNVIQVGGGATGK